MKNLNITTKSTLSNTKRVIGLPRLMLYLPLLFTILLGCMGKAEVKYVIVMISDGWGYNQILATDYWNGTTAGYESWAVAYAMTTYSHGGSYDTSKAWSDFTYHKLDYTDSAAASTAMSTGVKTYNGAIGVDSNRRPLKHLIERAESPGMATGVITSVMWAHATPAGFVAHNTSRSNYIDIASEMVYNSTVDVIMGAGHPLYGNDGEAVLGEAIDYQYVGGQSTWNDLVAGTAGGDADRDGVDDPWTLIQSPKEFQNLATGDTPDRVLGTAQVRHTLQYKRSGAPPANDPAPPYTVPLVTSVPSLEEMTLAALNILDNDPDGFFLVIEGGAVDWANHDKRLGRMIEEMDDFNKAFDAVVAWVEANSSWKEALVIVTGDHECGYLLGPGSGAPATFNTIIDNGPSVMPGFEYYSNSHTNSLIPLFAKGIGSEQFATYATNVDPVRGPYIDNTDIAHVIFSLYEEITE